ncbi:hypothetical protein niasHS_002696 [Heterodera schachtii]|uniref:F-box domain-containing protein n=1 Tax=Heterodera schachtii TaxID=97005 RepID=A0ABD2K268_HETSC
MPLKNDGMTGEGQAKDGTPTGRGHLLIELADQTNAFNALGTEVMRRVVSMGSIEDIEKVGPSLVPGLRLSARLAIHLRHQLSPIRLGDPLFEVLQFLPRKTLLDCVQLVNRRMHAIVRQRDALWPRFIFHRLQMFGDDELKRTAKMFLFKNAIQLKAPPAELSSIFTSLPFKIKFDSSDQNLLAQSVQLVAHHSGNSENGSPANVYFFIDVDEFDEDEEEKDADDEKRRDRSRNGTKFFFRLPNPLRTKMALSNCVWLFREFSKAHFESVLFELYRPSDALRLLLSQFDHFRPKMRSLPLLCRSLQSFHPFSVHFLQNFVRPSERVSVWDMLGTVEFFYYLVNGQRTEFSVQKADENGTLNDGKRMPDRFSAWGFVPQSVAIPSTDSFDSDIAEMPFFDALIQIARLTKCPNKIVRRISLNFKHRPSPWPRILPGMRLIGRTQTFQVDEEAEEGEDEAKESVEMSYRLNGFTNSTKFEVRVECEPGKVNEEMYSFELIREEER